MKTAAEARYTLRLDRVQLTKFKRFALDNGFASLQSLILSCLEDCTRAENGR